MQRFLRTQKAQIIKIDQLEFIKIQNFCSWKDNDKKTKGQITDWKDIFATYIIKIFYPEYI